MTEDFFTDTRIGVAEFVRVPEYRFNGSSLIERVDTTRARVVELFGEWDDKADADEGYGGALYIQSPNGEDYSIYTRWGFYRIGGFDRGEYFDALKKALEAGFDQGGAAA
jgi:hypothetical protein